jgi:hypothetical protein
MKAPHTSKQIFVEFMKRDGFDSKTAIHEFEEFLTINGQVRTKESYIMMSHVGSTIPTNRADRVSIYLTFENALNHATA